MAMNRTSRGRRASTSINLMSLRVPEVICPELPLRIMANINIPRIISLALEIRQELQSKAIGTDVAWIPVSIAKLPSPTSRGVAYVAPAYYGTAARAGTTVPVKAIKAVEILRDKHSWCWDCRKVDVYATFSDNNGGMIEIVHTQYFAATTAGFARDFWTLRYTSITDDGCFMVCEKSISESDGVQSPPMSLEFERTKILTSGYMIRPCDADNGASSTIYVVDHLDQEALLVPDIVRPLYLSPQLGLKRLIVPVSN